MSPTSPEFRRTSQQEKRCSPEWLARHVELAAAGDRRAWNQIVREFDAMLWAIARGHRLRHADGADAVQTTWLRLAENFHRVREPSRLGAWLATTARRECLRILRASKRELPEPEASEPVDVERPPIDLVVEAERDAALQSALRRLPSRDRALLLMLVADEPPTYKEIGAALKMPIGSIGPTRGRALARLRLQLERWQFRTDIAA